MCQVSLARSEIMAGSVSESCARNVMCVSYVIGFYNRVSMAKNSVYIHMQTHTRTNKMENTANPIASSYMECESYHFIGGSLRNLKTSSSLSLSLSIVSKRYNCRVYGL